MDLLQRGKNRQARQEARIVAALDAGQSTVLGDFFTLPEDVKQVYLPYAPGFIQEQYHRRRGHG